MRKPSLLIIFLSVFIDLIGFGIVLPLLPYYAANFKASGFVIGLILASFSAMQFFFAPAWGRLSDRIGRRPVILISNAGSTVSYAVFAIASGMEGTNGLWLLLASRICAGICGANLSVASAYIADISSRENRSRSMGLIGIAFGLGFILGPVIGGLASARYGLTGPGWAAAIICGFNFLLGCFILTESRAPGSAPAVKRERLAYWRETMAHPQLKLLIGIYFLATFCFTAFESTFSLLLKANFRYTGEEVSYLFAYCGVLSASVQGGGLKHLLKRFGEQRLIFLSLLVVALSLGLMPFMTNLTGLLIALGLFAIGSGINRPPTFGLISLNSSADEQGASLGVAQGAGSFARMIGPLIAATLFDVHVAIPYLLSALVALFAAICAGKYLCRPAEVK